MLLRFVPLCHALGAPMARLVRDLHDGPIDWVVSSDHAAVVFGQSVAAHLGAQYDFSVKTDGGSHVFNRQIIGEGDGVL